MSAERLARSKALLVQVKAARGLPPAGEHQGGGLVHPGQYASFTQEPELDKLAALAVHHAQPSEVQRAVRSHPPLSASAAQTLSLINDGGGGGGGESGGGFGIPRGWPGGEPTQTNSRSAQQDSYLAQILQNPTIFPADSGSGDPYDHGLRHAPPAGGAGGLGGTSSATSNVGPRSPPPRPGPIHQGHQAAV